MKYNIRLLFTWDDVDEMESYTITVPDQVTLSDVEDKLCENHHYVNNDRYFADKVFERLLEVGDVGCFRRWLMFHSVDNFQKFCRWRKDG